METIKKILFHVGLPKTGSTYIQKHIFSKLEDVYFSGINSKYRYTDCFKELATLNDNKCDTSLYSKEKKDALVHFIKNLTSSSIIYSHEGLVGKAIQSFSNCPRNVQIINTLFPEAKIFIVFRKQDDWIQSYYNETFVRIQIPFRLNQFLDMQDYLSEPKLNWLKIYQLFINSFGMDNVLALPYEMFRDEAKGFLNAFYDFFQIKPYYPDVYVYENKSVERNNISESSYLTKICFILLYDKVLNNVPISISRKIKSLLGSKLKGLLRFIGSGFNYKNEIIDDHTKQTILSLYGNSNKELSELIQINLSNYGYY